MLLTLEVLASFALQLFCKFRVGLGVFWCLFKKICWLMIRTRQHVEVIHTIWVARDTSGIQKYPTVILGEASRGGVSSWPTCVVISVVVRWQLDFFFFTLFSLSFTHSKLKNFLTFCIISIAVLILFYCSVFALNSFYDFFLILSFIILFYFYFYVRFVTLFFNWYLFCFSSFF